MISTDYTTVMETLNMLLEKEAYIRIDRTDINKMFPNMDFLQLINVAGSDEEEMTKAFKEDYASIHDEPKVAAAFLLCQSMNMNGLVALNDSIPCPNVYKRAIIFETSDAGERNFYFFFH